MSADYISFNVDVSIEGRQVLSETYELRYTGNVDLYEVAADELRKMAQQLEEGDE